MGTRQDPDSVFLELAQRLRSEGLCIADGAVVVDRGGGMILVEDGRQRSIFSIYCRFESVLPGLELQGLVQRCRFGCETRCGLMAAA